MEATALPSVSGQLFSWLLGAVFFWALGLLTSWLLPRPKWLQRTSLWQRRTVWLATPPGLWFRRITLTIHATMIVRQVWRYFNSPGTFRALLKALWLSVRHLRRFEWPRCHHDGKVPLGPEAEGEGSEDAAAGQDALPNWHVTQADLAFFRHKVEAETEEAAAKWDHMMDLAYEGTTYSAWRRPTAGGKTEYKSITLTPNATAEEFMDFYLDDPTRPKWDGMITEYSVVEAGPAAQRCLVVRWKRTFPFSFISSREYVIARRLFRVGDALYGITKGVEHPAVPGDGKTVRCGTFYSMWRCRTVPNPHGSDRPACETVLLHSEDMKVPERLAKFAVRHGMPGFFKGMVPQVKEFVAKRRIRLAPTQPDADAYGCSPLAALPAAPLPPRCASAGALSDAGSEASFATDSAFEPLDAERVGLRKSPSLRRLGYMMLASGVALAIARTGSSSSLAASGSGSGSGAAGSGGSGSAGGKGHHGSGASGKHRSSGGSGHGGRKHSHHHGGSSAHGSSGSGGAHRQPHSGSGRPHRRRGEVAQLAAVMEE